MAERITGHTELIGLMAYPIRHSSSPAMQNEAFAKLGYDYAYLAFEVGADEIEDAVKAIRTLKMRGSNVSMPNKTLVGQYLDELSPAAELCGAVNTIVNDNGHLTGHITDGIGFMQSLSRCRSFGSGTEGQCGTKGLTGQTAYNTRSGHRHGDDRAVCVLF